MSAVLVSNLSKQFELSVPGPGVFGSFRRTKKIISAVSDLSFSIGLGERVAFIGPNGAGKSTTIKMLSGILLPSTGEISVLGCNPVTERKKLSYRIGLVFGQRSQLWSHLPVRDSFTLLSAIYDVDVTSSKTRAGELSELLEIERLLDSPAAKLSLGERMRCELVAALLHRPSLLFLDEPTIGLDVSARALLRSYIRKISEQEKVTILLTSHDTTDISEVCNRTILINHGALVLDKPMNELKRGLLKKKRLHAVFAEKILPAMDVALGSLLSNVKIVERMENALVLEIDTSAQPIDGVIRTLLGIGAVQDITVEDPPLEEIIMQFYSNARGDPGATRGTP